MRSARQQLEEELADDSAHGGDDNEVVRYDEDNFQDVSFDARATLPTSIWEEEAHDPFIRVATCILKDLPMPKDIDDFLVEDRRKEFSGSRRATTKSSDRSDKAISFCGRRESSSRCG